jgi:hypothetical protein
MQNTSRLELLVRRLPDVCLPALPPLADYSPTKRIRIVLSLIYSRATFSLHPFTRRKLRFSISSLLLLHSNELGVYSERTGDQGKMGDRYTSRYGAPRPRSPIYNPARASLPINLAYPHEQSSRTVLPINLAYPHEQPHMHVVPSSRREVSGPRNSNTSITNSGTITTTYKVTAEPARGSSVREGSRTRRSTLDNHNRPTVPAIVTTTATPRHRPVVHSSGANIRAASPIKDPYRSSQEDYVAIPASSRHGNRHHHRPRYSMTMDNADMNRLAQENGRLRIAPVRESNYAATRARPIHSGSLVRHADTVADDYGDNGYGYTNASDLVRYDLNNSQPAPHHLRARRDGYEGGRVGGRPLSTSGYNDVATRSYDARERGPPPSMRGFDKLHGRTTSWDQGSGPVRMPVAPMPPQPPSMSATEPFARSAFEPVELPRRTSSTRVRPTSLYHDRDTRRGSREDYYEVRDEEPRHRRQHRDIYDDDSEDQGFASRDDSRIERPHSRVERLDGDRGERIERPHSRVDRADRYDRPDRVERVERSDRVDRNERGDRTEKDKDRSEHKGRDALATGLSIAGAALGINAVKNSGREDREDRDERDEWDERRRERRDREKRESVDLTGRDPKERRRGDDDSSPIPNNSHMPPPPRDIHQDRDGKNRSPSQPEAVDVVGRAPRERQPSKDERESDSDRRERHRHRAEAALAGAAAGASGDSRSDSSEEIAPRTSRRKRESGATPAFNPKDASDLKALKDQLNAKEPPKVPAKEPESRTPRVSSTKDAREAAEVRKDLQEAERRPREPLQPAENKQLRVVSPPREKLEEKPVKGILRIPKEKFPEDPSPIREGVAPLKDAKKDGIPPDARWTKISRKLVNPEALELGKERFEARDDFVIVLRVLTREEVQGYAEVTSKLRANREELEEIAAMERRRKRRARHEEQKRERERGGEHKERVEKERRHHRRERESESSTDSEDGDQVRDRPKMLEAPKRKTTFEEALMMSGGLGTEAERDKISIPSRRDDR